MAMPDVTDEYGLVNVNEYLTAIIPATKKALIFRVMSRINAGSEEFNYGALPITAAIVAATTAYSNETAGTWVAAAANGVGGVIGSESYNTTSFSFTPPTDIVGTFDTSDMWYLKKEYRKYIFHTIMEVTPSWLQIEMEIPKGVKQGRFQNDQGVQTGIGKSFGYTRGKIETIFIPEFT